MAFLSRLIQSNINNADRDTVGKLTIMYIFHKIANQVIIPPRICTRTRFLPVEARNCLAHAQTRYGADRVPGHCQGPLTVISALHIFLAKTSGFLDTTIVFGKLIAEYSAVFLHFFFESNKARGMCSVLIHSLSVTVRHHC